MEPDDDLLDAMVRGRAEFEAAELRAARDRWQAIPPEPYLLTFSGLEADRPHRFCPETPIPGGDCPNCSKPLLRLVSFDTQRLPFALGSAPPRWIHLLYCWTCAIPYGLLSYRFGQSGEVEIVDYVREDAGSFGPEGPYDGYTGLFPSSSVGLRALTAEEQSLALELRTAGEEEESTRHLTGPVHQVGGFPMIYNPQDVFCGVCQQPSPFFATICDNAVGQDYQSEATLSFTKNCGVQMVFHYCPDCAAVTAYHSCD